MTLILAEGHKVNSKQTLLASFAGTLFNWMSEMWWDNEAVDTAFEWDLLNQWK